MAACNDGADTSEPVVSPTPIATIGRQPDAIEAGDVLNEFFAAVTDGDINKAWARYAASIPGTIEDHREDVGCGFLVFQTEFPRMRKMLERLSPLEALKSFGVVEGSVTIEFTLAAADGEDYLATLMRVEPDEPYRLRFFNSGDVSMVPGAPDPLPSPDEPQGVCGIWTGGR